MQMQEVEVPIDGSEGLPGPIKVLFAVAAVLTIGVIAFVMLSFEGPDPEKLAKERLETEKLPGLGDDHLELRFVFEEDPILNPQWEPLPESGLDEIRAIAVRVGDESRAFALGSGTEKDFMLVSTTIAGTELVICHNYRTEESWVFTSMDGQPVDVQLGGQDVKLGIVLLIAGDRFSISSPRIPLEEYDFEITTLDKLAEEHPNTLVCMRDLTYKTWDDDKVF